MTLERAAALSCFVAYAVVVTGCEGTPAGMIPDRALCRTCEIVIDVVEVIGDTTEANSLTGRPRSVWQDGTGRYFINVLDAFPMVYNPQTGILERFGREGSGPGEYQRPAVRALLPGDSLLVSDAFTYFVVGPDLQVKRSFRVATDLPGIAVVDWPGNVLGTSRRLDRRTEMIQTVVTAYDMSGDNLQAVDTLLATGPISGRDPTWVSSLRLLGEVADDGSLWISDYNSYRMVQYRTGEPVDSIARRPGWFPGGAPMAIGGPDEPASPHMLGNWVDEEGLLWVLASQPRPDTRDAWKDVPSLEGVREVRVASLPAQYKLNQTVIEVIDLNERRVLTRHIFDGYVIDILPGQRFASYVETEAGVPVLRIHGVTLRRGDM